MISLLMPHAAGQASAAAAGPPLSKIDIYAGYSYFTPFESYVDNIPYVTVPYGATGSMSAYFTRNLGVQLEGNYAPNSSNDNNCVYTAQAGPIFRVQKGRFVPFAHALGGAAIVGGPRNQNCGTWGYGVTGGLGLDIILPFFHDHIAFRPIQADFLWSKVDYGPVTATGQYGGDNQIYAIRGSAGFVYRIGDMHPADLVSPTFNCTVDPGNPLPGDPVTLTASTMDINPKHKPRYLWECDRRQGRGRRRHGRNRHGEPRAGHVCGHGQAGRRRQRASGRLLHDQLYGARVRAAYADLHGG